MKNCDQCGASNPTRAQFCNACGAKFRIADAVPASRVNIEKETSSNSKSSRKKEISTSSIRSSGQKSGPGVSGSTFWSTTAAIFTVLWQALRYVVRRGGPLLVAAFRKAPAFFATLGKCLKFAWKKTKPTRENLIKDAPKYAAAAWRQFRVALAPSATWTPAQIPNFLVWGVVDFFIWSLPFSLVGIFYAILANEAKRMNDVELARFRAANAKGWLLADFTLGVLLTIFGVGSFFFRAIF